MFSTIKDQLEMLTGPLASNLQLTTILTYSAWEMFMQLPENAAMKWASQSGATSMYDLTGLRFLGVLDGTEGDLYHSRSYENPQSIYYATEEAPVYYFNVNSVYVIPSGYVIYLELPFITGSEEQIISFPYYFSRPVILKAAVKIKENLINERRDELHLLTFAARTLPVAPPAPDYTYTDAAVSLIAQNTISAFGSLPAYNAELQAAPSVTVDLSGISVPAAPQAPNFSYSDAAAAGLSAVTIESFGSVPSYSVTLPTDHTVVLDTVSVPSGVPDPPDFNYVNAVVSDISASSIGSFGTEPVYIAELPDVPVFIVHMPSPPVPPLAPEFTFAEAEAARISSGFTLALSSQHSELTSMINQDEDIELARVKIDEILSRVEEYKAISQTELMKLAENAKMSTDINLQNKIQGLQKQIHQYSKMLELYQAQLQKYQTDIQVKIEEGKINLGTYQTNIQSVLLDGKNRFEKELSVYQAAVEKQIEQAKMIQQAALENMQKTANVELQNRLQTVNSLIEKYKLGLQLYVSKLELYKTDVERSVTKAELQLKTYETVSQVKLLNAQNTFNASNQAYQAVIQKNIEQARLSAQMMTEQFSRTTDLNLQNKIQALQGQVQLYSAKLQTYAADIEGYRTKANLKFEQAKLELDKYQAESQIKMQDALNRFQKDNIVFQAEVQKVLEQAKIDEERLSINAKNTTDVSLQNKMQALQSEIQKYALRLQRYQSEVQLYGLDIQSDIQKFQGKSETVKAEIQLLAGEIEMLKKEYEIEFENIVRTYT